MKNKQQKLIEGIKYCIECEEPLIETPPEFYYDGFSDSSRPHYEEGYCNNSKCSRYGLITVIFKSNKKIKI